MFCLRSFLRRSATRSSFAKRTFSQSQCASAGRSRAPRKDHWTAEKLATSDEYPLTGALNKVMHPSMAQKKTRHAIGKSRIAPKTFSHVHLRTQIVSPGLCDDVLKHMSHTLEKHKGCDILDINPGACLWSRKLHDFLQPRTHVLLEPNPEIFKDFLDPLLDAPDSKYKLVQKDPIELCSYREIVDEGVFAHQTRVDPADPKAQEVNNTLLVIGSLVWDPVLAGLAFDSMAKQIYHHFTKAVWANDLFHAYGPVHTLLWVQHDDFIPTIAQSLAGMGKANRTIEMTQKMSMVVQSARKARSAGRSSREPQYEMESLVRALRSGRERDLDLPPHRRENSYNFAMHIDEISGGTGISRVKPFHQYLYRLQFEGQPVTGWLPQSSIDHIEAQRQLKTIFPDLPTHELDAKPPAETALNPRFSYSKDHPLHGAISKSRAATTKFKETVKIKSLCEEAADIGEQMYMLECKALRMGPGPDKDLIIAQIEELDHAWDQAVANVKINYQDVPVNEVDDRINLRHPPGPRIQWDQRVHEPLLFHENEAWPTNRLALVFASPKAKLTGDSEDHLEWLFDFIHAIYNKSVLPLPVALDSLQHGLSDIVKDCPSLTDPDKGGRMQLKHFRVRMLTEEMINELVHAYRNWPFKPPGTDHCMFFRNKGS